MTLLIIIAIAIALFGLAFMTKRRFGVLGLGLAAGVLLAQNASKFVAGFLSINSVPVEPLTYDSAAVVSLTLLPALLLLIGGPKYFAKRPAVIGAAAFSVLGTLLILGPLTTALPTDDDTIRQVLNFVADWQAVIIAAAIVTAVLDTVLLHTGKSASPKHGKH